MIISCDGAGGACAMSRQDVFEMPFEKVYQCLVQKAERKGRTKKMRQLDKLIDELTTGKPMEKVLR